MVGHKSGLQICAEEAAFDRLQIAGRAENTYWVWFRELYERSESENCLPPLLEVSLSAKHTRILSWRARVFVLEFSPVVDKIRAIHSWKRMSLGRT